MGLRMIRGYKDCGRENECALLYCSTSGRALPWIFESVAEAEAFVEEYGDVRRLSTEEQERCYNEWISEGYDTSGMPEYQGYRVR